MRPITATTTTHYPLVLVLERSPSSRGEAVRALRERRLLAFAAAPSVEWRGFEPRVLVADLGVPQASDAAAIRDWLGPRGPAHVVVVSELAATALPADVARLATVCLRKPVEWARVAAEVRRLACGLDAAEAG